MPLHKVYFLFDYEFILQISIFGLYLVLKVKKTEDVHGFQSVLWFVNILSLIVCTMLLSLVVRVIPACSDESGSCTNTKSSPPSRFVF
jgi:energy-coupling factor transporter transmembrane protein EcfT